MLEAVDGTRLVSKGEFQLPPVSAKDMPGDVVNAVLSIEDKRFYQRGAIDPRSMLRAFIENERAGQVVAGGSTITQQLAKILFLDPQRTYRRKIQEAAIAIWLNLHLSKEQILTSYLNNVYLGAGAIGFPAAAKLYFSKNVNDLTLSEAAMLAGMISAPVHYDPLHDLSAARARRNGSRCHGGEWKAHPGRGFGRQAASRNAQSDRAFSGVGRMVRRLGS